MLTGLLMTFIGFGFVNYFFREESLIAKLAVGFLLGFGLLTIPLLILIYNHIPLQQAYINALILIFTAASSLLIILKIRPLNKKTVVKKIKQLSPLQIILILGILFFISASFVMNSYWPVNTWDAISLYDLRGRIYAGGGLLTNLWEYVNRNPEALSYYYSYPPLTSLSHSLAYMIHEFSLMGIYSFFYASMIALFYFFVSKRTSLTVALFTTLLLASNETLLVNSSFAYTNLPYTAALIAAIFSLEEYLRARHGRYLFLSIYLTVLSIMIRSVDPFYLLVAGYLLLYAFKDRKLFKNFLLLLGISLAAKFFVDSYYSRDIFVLTGKSQPLQAVSLPIVIKAFLNPARIWEATVYIYQALKNYYLYILMFLVSAVAFYKSTKKQLGMTLFILASILILIPGAVFLSSYYPDWNEIPQSIDRLMMILYPLILYFLTGIEEFKNLKGILGRSKTFFSSRKK